MNVLPYTKRGLTIRCLCDGLGVCGTARVVDVSKNTVLKLLCDAGRAARAAGEEKKHQQVAWPPSPVGSVL